jgi:hypothetical protein
MWCDRHELPDLKTEIFERQIDGNELLTLFQSGLMARALGLSNKTMTKVKKALEMKDGALLTKEKFKVNKEEQKEKEKKKHHHHRHHRHHHSRH